MLARRACEAHQFVTAATFLRTRDTDQFEGTDVMVVAGAGRKHIHALLAGEFAYDRDGIGTMDFNRVEHFVRRFRRRAPHLAYAEAPKTARGHGCC